MTDADTEMASVWNEIRKYEPYRKYAMSNRPSCHNCYTKQVQLISHTSSEARFKCRHCRHEFKEKFRD